MEGSQNILIILYVQKHYIFIKRIKAKKNVLRGISSDLLIIIKMIKDFLDDKSNSVIRHIT